MALFNRPRGMQWLPIVTTVFFAALLTALLAFGMKRATQLQAASAALQDASALVSHPTALLSNLRLLQRGLESRNYVGDSLRSVQSARTEIGQAMSTLAAKIETAGQGADSSAALALGTSSAAWPAAAEVLATLSGVQSNGLYVDSLDGSSLSASGRALKSTVDALLSRHSKPLTDMAVELNRLAGELRVVVDRDGRNLRTLLLAGTAIASVLLALALYFSWRERSASKRAESAQRQVDNILNTVREGLFLVDPNGVISATQSRSLAELLRVRDVRGMRLEDLLRNLVDEKTLLAANKFLGLLWKDKVNEELIQSVNPLSQVAVSFERAQGGRELRHLSFSFRRVRGNQRSADEVLVSVADITDRVLLQQELEQARSSGEAHGTLLMQLLQVDPQILKEFLNNVEIACRKCNAALSRPGADRAELMSKLDAVFRELHALKGEASALNMSSYVQRLHEIEDQVAELRSSQSLGGDDFVPLVVRLEGLLNHADELLTMQQRVMTMRQDAQPTPAPASHAPVERRAVAAPHGAASNDPAARAPLLSLEPLLRSLANKVASANSRNVNLKAVGLEQVPSKYASLVRDIAVQLVRNAVVHGLEPPETRAASGKLPGGTVMVSFADGASGDYELLIEDDGQGLKYELILDKALRAGLVKPQEAARLDKAAVYRFIFQPGFTTADSVSEHAGRGVGLDVVNNAVRECGGRVGISTAPGQFTRFKIVLPRRFAPQSSAA